MLLVVGRSRRARPPVQRMPARRSRAKGARYITRAGRGAQGGARRERGTLRSDVGGPGGEPTVTDGRAPVTLERIELGSPRIREFVEVPWRLFRGDPNWTPPLRGDLLGSRLLKLNGLLTPGQPLPPPRRGLPLDRVARQRVGRVHLGVGGPGLQRVPPHAPRATSASSTWPTTSRRRPRCSTPRAPGSPSAGCSRCGARASTATRRTSARACSWTASTRRRSSSSRTTRRTTARCWTRYGLVKVKDYVAYHLDMAQPVPAELPRIAAHVRGHHPEITTRAGGQVAPRGRGGAHRRALQRVVEGQLGLPAAHAGRRRGHRGVARAHRGRGVHPLRLRERDRRPRSSAGYPTPTGRCARAGSGTATPTRCGWRGCSRRAATSPAAG